MQLAKPLKRNPREVALALIEALRAQPAVRRWVEAMEIAGPGFINLRLKRRRARQAIVRRGARCRRALRPARADAQRPQQRAGRVRLGQPDRPAARRPRSPGRARRRHLPPARDAGLGGDARVLLQRRRRADRHPGGLDAGAHPRPASRATPAGPSRPTTASTSPTSPPTSWRGRRSRPTTASSPPRATPTTSTASASSPSPTCATSRTSTCRPSACASTTTSSSPSLYSSGRVERHGAAPRSTAGKTYERDGALWLRSHRVRRRQGPRHAQVATARYTYFVPDVAYHIDKWRARLHQGRSTSRAATTTARSRACAPACRPPASACRRATPTTCCTRW